MTIFTSKVSDKKEDADAVPTEVVVEYKPLVEDEKTKMGAMVAPRATPSSAAVAIAIANQRRQSMMKMCIMLVSLVLVMVVVLLGIMVCKHLFSSSPAVYRGVCGVRYHKNGDEIDENAIPMALAQSGEFEQEVTIDDDEHETIGVPNIGDTQRATVMLDFNKNITAIVDKEQGYCFILPLNRTLVVPPRDFVDLLIKLKTGYYIPDVELIRENYRALTPPVADLTPYGVNIRQECQSFDTYRLVRDGEPVAISKRSAAWCDFMGKSWCLGDAGGKKMQCVTISSCM